MSFASAFTKTMQVEGGYANHPNDRGGETYRGVARNMHPTWAGWHTVDVLRSEQDFPKCLDNDPELQRDVEAFYFRYFWEPWKGNDVAGYSSEIADEMFDIAVNMGWKRAAKMLQLGLNLLNRNEDSWADIKVDGWIGEKSLIALEACAARHDILSLYKLLNVLQGARYIQICRDNPSQEVFLRGWLSRVDISER